MGVHIFRNVFIFHLFAIIFFVIFLLHLRSANNATTIINAECFIVNVIN